MVSRAKYAFQTLHKENFWLPPAIAVLFLIIVAIVGPEQRYGFGRAFLGYVLPMLPGGLSAYAFLADSALELQLTTHHSAARMIFERLSVIFGMIVIVSMVFQLGFCLMDVSLDPLGGVLARQLIWLVPCFMMMTLGAAAALVFRNTSVGFAVVGGWWIIQLILRARFAASPVLRSLLIFYAVMEPFGAARWINEAVLVGLSLVFLVVTHSLLKKQERYL